jgi:hypothetical protein
MSNVVKYNESLESETIRTGNFWIGVGDVGKGPTDITGFWNGVKPPNNGYTVYLNKPNNGPSIYQCFNDAELIETTNIISNNNFTTIFECFHYYQSQTDKFCVDKDYVTIVTKGLFFNLDASFIPSYPRSGNIWYDISKFNLISEINGATFSTEFEGCLVFDGIDDYVVISPTASFI